MGFSSRRAVLAWSTVSILGLLVSQVASANDPSTPGAAESASLGVTIAPARPDLIQRFESTYDVDVKYAIDYLATEDWSSIDNPGWWINGWRGSGYEVIWSVPMLVNGTSLAQGAAGEYDHHFRSLARALNDAGLGDATIRLGWEFNGNWQYWYAGGGNQTDFTTYWRRIVNTMRAVSPTFRFDWCANAGPSSMPADQAYPGDAYVDTVGIDAYDGPWLGSTPAQRWSNNLNQSYGLVWHASFAAAHGKPMTYGEWGLINSDNPLYIQNMHDWFITNDVAWASYFDVLSGSNDHRLASHPSSAATFTQDFGSPATSEGMWEVAED